MYCGHDQHHNRQSHRVKVNAEKKERDDVMRRRRKMVNKLCNSNNLSQVDSYAIADSGEILRKEQRRNEILRAQTSGRRHYKVKYLK